MRDGEGGNNPLPLLSSESFRNVLLSESVIAGEDTRVTSATFI